MTERLRVGIDVGGTFTDLVLLAGGEVITRKVPSTPTDYSQGIIDGLRLVLADRNVSGDLLQELVHGMTVVPNTVIERKGARTGLITTQGFRDVLEIGRLTTPRPLDMSWKKPAPLVEGQLRAEVQERVGYGGDVVVPLSRQDVERAIDEFIRLGVESVAICLLHSYAFPDHEIEVEEIVRERAPHVYVSRSSAVLPDRKEFERTSTTVIDAYVKPIMGKYLDQLRARLEAEGVRVPLLVMQSNGGIMTAEEAQDRPSYTAESGPAAGVVAAWKWGRTVGYPDLISFDMGGTTAKAAIVEGGALDYCDEIEIGGYSTGGWRFLRGGGYLLRLPSIDISEVGSGGGSIAWIDSAVVLQVGPQSAGAVPGPVSYDKGGTQPTVTDANVLLGFFNPQALAGGELRLNEPLAREVMENEIARRLGVKVEEAAYGIFSIVNAKMIRAVKAVTTERGRDPSRHVLVTYGGCGPAHAAAVARALGIKTVMIPPAAGVFSSVGLLFADTEHHYVKSYWRSTEIFDFADANAVLRGIEQEATATLEREGFSSGKIELTRHADMNYARQAYELPIPFGSSTFTPSLLGRMVEEFHGRHEQLFGYRSTEEVRISRLRVNAKGIPDAPRVPETLRTHPHDESRNSQSRRVYFGPEFGWLETPILTREDLRGSELPGPAIVEDYDCTTVVPPQASVAVDTWANVIITLGT